MIEGDLRAVRSAPVAPVAPQQAAAAASSPPRRRPSRPAPRCRRNRSLNCRIPLRPSQHFAAAPRDFHAAQPMMPAAAMAPKAISEILEPHTAPPRAAIEPELPPDHPLEPGTRPTGRAASPSERIAASENAISEISAGAERAGQHIEFHCRRAPRCPGRRGRAGRRQGCSRADKRLPPATRPANPRPSPPRFARCWSAPAWSSSCSARFKMAMTLLDGGSPPQPPAMESSGEPPPPAQPPAVTAQAGRAGSGDRLR